MRLFSGELACFFLLFHGAEKYSDPWWIFTTVNLFWNIKRRYDFGILELVKQSPRFGILLLSMTLSIAFLILDCLSVTDVIAHALPDGLNPFWKLSFVFKCFTDTIILDDFKTALDKLKDYKLDRINATSSAGDTMTEPLPPPGIRKTAELQPWNESEGVTTDDKRNTQGSASDVDLERQLHDWMRREGSPSNSTATK
jgi:hypothetical protein